MTWIPETFEYSFCKKLVILFRAWFNIASGLTQLKADAKRGSTASACSSPSRIRPQPQGEFKVSKQLIQ